MKKEGRVDAQRHRGNIDSKEEVNLMSVVSLKLYTRSRQVNIKKKE